MVKTFVGVLLLQFWAIHYFTAPLYGMVNYIGLKYIKAIIWQKLIVTVAIGEYSNQDHAEFKKYLGQFAFHGISKKSNNMFFLFE
jgi:hypothetical protein